MSFDELLTQSCVVYTHQKVTDSYGDSTLTWTAGATILCRVQPLSASYRAIAGGAAIIAEVSKPQYRIYVKVGSTIAQGDKLVVAALSQSFMVKFAKKDSSGHHWELDCEELDFIQ